MKNLPSSASTLTIAPSLWKESAHFPSPFRHTASRWPSLVMTCFLIGLGSLLGTRALADEQHGDFVSAAHHFFLAGDLQQAQVQLDQALRKQPDNLRAVAEQAFLDDANGRHRQARQRYDRLKGTEQAGLIAIPSAVNLVALSRFSAAGKAFAEVAAHATDAQPKAYADLWSLWLMARQGAAPGANSRAQAARLAAAAKRIQPGNPQQQALLQLYQGGTDSAAVFTAIDGMPVNDLIKRDLTTEASLFAGAYQQYVRHDLSAARQLYQRGFDQSIAASVERPLLEQMLRDMSSR